MGSLSTTSGLTREFNAESEQLAADRRARVAAAVSQQEWLDKQEVKWIPKKYRNCIRHGDGDEDAEELNIEEGDVDPSELDYMKVPAPIDDPQDAYKAIGQKYGYHWAVAIFALVLLGSVYFFWDSMHTHIDPHRPGMMQVDGQDMGADSAVAAVVSAPASDNPMADVFTAS
mmetsp:Transcript_33783/g.46780  ORF Transcript_33783/g.46780 Transcript_33783/m.46780 type:complete len:172 (+) Transcript_33783:165-680(+)|eukprot:CAMPEP_0196581582 /NCGR_PEP_ID=MMETSP1081-20130531/34436_1 /TAXON_ID=36882 /ORGANISM="Pyramimonas amylifera, Strain CCMP720" /LENGTH=171 /DNA_ID=CAMNT_0041901865 /DNA_START=151 /DNA_END=666 /DNA_ORIENTATION=+